MSTHKPALTPTSALTLVRAKRPIVDPNSGFLAQLQLFHLAGCPACDSSLFTGTGEANSDSTGSASASGLDSLQRYKAKLMQTKAVRTWYLERKADQMRDGYFSPNDEAYVRGFEEVEVGVAIDSLDKVDLDTERKMGTEMGTDDDTAVTTVHEAAVREAAAAARRTKTRRRIVRCRMCRCELAGREDMLEHTRESSLHEEKAEHHLKPLLTNPKCSGYFIEPVRLPSSPLTFY